MTIEVIQALIPSKPGLLPLDAGAPKIVLHTTEAGDRARYAARDIDYITNVEQGILATWNRGDGYPTQYLVTVQTRRAVQCVPNSAGSYALEDSAGGVRTNRAGSRVIQIEINGHASQLADEWNEADWRWLGELLRQLCASEGVPFVFPVEFAQSPGAYGLNAAQRLTGAEYAATAGIIGHQHVPENAHSDPGLLRIDLLTASTSEEDDVNAWQDPRYKNAFWSSTCLQVADGEAGFASIHVNAAGHDQKLATCCRLSFGVAGATPGEIIAKAVAAGFLVPA